MSTATRELARRALAELDAGRRPLLATLVGHDGASYLAPGASLLVGADGPIAGLLSGGCLEDEVAARALGPDGAGVRMTVDTSGDEIDGLGLGCGGSLDIVAEPVHDRSGWRAWLEAVATGAPAARRIRPTGSAGWRTPAGAFGHAPPPWQPGARPHDVRARLRPASDGWLETVAEPPRLTLVGHGPEVEALAIRAARLGWRIRAIGPSRVALERLERALVPAGADVAGALTTVHAADASALAGAQGAEGALGVTREDRLLIASRRLDVDAAALAWGARGGARYLGVVAGRRRMAVLASRPELAGTSLAHVDGPAGLDVGAEGPEEIATAVAARLVADLRAASAPVWAVIPAAGEGRRMGGAKPLLRKDGRTLLSRALRTAEAACDGTIVVLGHDAERIAQELDASACAVVADAWRNGLRASLRAGLTAVPAGARALVLLPDMPGVDAAHLASLRAAARSGPDRTLADRGVTDHALADHPLANDPRTDRVPASGDSVRGVSAGSAPAGAASRHADGRRGAPAVLPPDLVDAVVSGSSPERDEGLGALLNERTDVATVVLGDPGDLDTPEQAAARGWLPG